MTTPPSSEFSYDLYPGLDDELQAALERNIANGTAGLAEIATAGLAAAVAEHAAGPNLNTEWSSLESLLWCTNELSSARESWLDYQLDAESNESLGTLYETKIATLNRLYEAREDLITSGENTPNGSNVGESMHLTLVPWKIMLDNLSRLPKWFNDMRSMQKTTTVLDNFGLIMTERLQNYSIYRNPDYSANIQGETDWMTTKDYLEQRVRKDGGWGVLLTQTSNEAGMGSMLGKSPDELTKNGSKHFEVNGQCVDGLGILEWLAMKLQHNPAELSANDESLLLANHFYIDGILQVPCGEWNDGRAFLYFGRADRAQHNVRPRLAVL
jgi:hypothetical protein